MGKHAKKKQQQSDTSAKEQTPAPIADIAPVPGFFGCVIKPGQTLSWANEVEEFSLNLNSAALGGNVSSTTNNDRSTLFVLAKDTKIALCTLSSSTHPQWNLTQTFTPLDGEIKFINEGTVEIHLTGFIEVQDEEDDTDYAHDFDDDDHEDDDDEEMDESEMMIFGDDDTSSDEDDDDDDDEDDSDDDDNEGRFEVLEERLHGDVKPAKKEEKSPVAKKEDKNSTVKEEKNTKSHAKAAAKSPAKEDKKPAQQQSDKKDETPTSSKKAKKEKPSAEKAATSASSKKEQKVAEKIAELTGNNANNKKRPAPAGSVEMPKKTKVAKRVHKGVTIEEHAVGKGQPVQRGKKVRILYRGRLENGKQFDAAQNRNQPFSFRHGFGDVIKGMDIGIEGMRSGGKRTIHIPAKLGYGRQGAPPTIPGNANLIFDIELL